MNDLIRNQMADKQDPGSARGVDQLYSIGDLAADFNISTRAIRFYESKNLLHPKRVGSNRIYDHRQRARLKIILRGKRLGFTLEEIGDYLALYDADPSQAIQIRHLLEKVSSSIDELEQKKADVEKTLSELKQIRTACHQALDDKT